MAIGNAGSYSVVVNTLTGTLTSVPATLTIRPDITIQPSSQTLTSGSPFTLTVTAIGSPTLTYAWSKNGNPIPGAIASTYKDTAAAITDSGLYTVRVTNVEGTATSSAAHIIVNPLIAKPSNVTISPNPVNAIIGSAITLTVNVGSGTPPFSYQWQKNNVPLGDSTGAYVIASAAMSDSGTYLVAVSNTGGNTLSGSDHVTVIDTSQSIKPSVSILPNPASVNIGYSITLTAVTQGTPPFSYQWQNNGVNLADTADTYNIYSAAMSDSGVYTVTISKSAVPVASTTDHLTVTDTGILINPCSLHGIYIGTDSMAVVVGNMKLIDTALVDSFAVWCGTSPTDTVPNFSNTLSAGWFNIQSVLVIGKDSLIFVDSQVNASTPKILECAVILKGKTGKLSPVIKVPFTVGTSTPLSSNTIILAPLVFDTSNDRIKAKWSLSNPGNDSLDVGISYSTTGYLQSPPINMQVIPVKSDTDSAVVQLHENLVFNATYYIGLWESKAGGVWMAPTVSSDDSIGIPSFNWQSVTYFTKIGGDTAFAFNNNVRLITDSVSADNVANVRDTLRIWSPASQTLTGFVPVSMAFKFSDPQQSAPFSVSLKYLLPPSYSAGSVRIYRWQDSVWTIEFGSIVDSISGYVSVKTNVLGAVFIAMIDTIPVTVSETHVSIVNALTALSDTFLISDNCAGIKWQFMYAKGADAYDPGNMTNGTIGYTRSGTVIVQIPSSFVTDVSGVRAVFTATDGVQVTQKNVSRQVRRTNSDFILTTPLEWQVLKVTAALDSQSIKYALRDTTGQNPWVYDSKQIRLYRWYPDSSNAKSSIKWVEYPSNPSLFQMACGNLIWIKTKNRMPVDFGSGVTLPLNATYDSIILSPNNWTDFAVPFKFNIRVGDILDSIQADTSVSEKLEFCSWRQDSAKVLKSEPLYIGDFAGTGTLADKSTSLSCFDLTGYTVFNPTLQQIQLRVPPIPDVISQYNPVLSKKLSKKSATVTGWAVKIDAVAASEGEISTIYYGYDGTFGNATNYYPMGPSFADIFMGIYNAKENNIYGNMLTGTMPSGGCAFQLAFINHSANSASISCNLSTCGIFPDSFSTKIYDEDLAEFENTPITVSPNSTEYRWVFVGSKSYLAKAITLYASPLRLVEAYPNPFKSFIHIRYTFPSDGLTAVKFAIYDLRGRLLWRRVVNAHQGMDELMWNAKTQNGDRVTAGIYVLTMTGLDANQRQVGVFEKKLTLLP